LPEAPLHQKGSFVKPNANRDRKKLFSAKKVQDKTKEQFVCSGCLAEFSKRNARLYDNLCPECGGKMILKNGVEDH
jgi:DNA-directed RNA polymerase subunit RPC12/RpoP